jgi:hypothetical protein
VITGVSTRTSDRICQGDILRDVECIESIEEREGEVRISRVVFPLVIVLTQDCDLEQDHKFRADPGKTQDKWLMSVLVAPLYNVEHVYKGEHLSELELKMEPITKGRSPGTFLRNNERPRYHYLEFPKRLPIVDSVIDFKHYFSAHILYLQELKRKPGKHVCTLDDLFRHDVSARFAAFLARVALPELEDAAKARGA